MNLDRNLIVDYLRITIPVGDEAEQRHLVAMLMGMFLCRELPYGRYGYTRGLAFFDCGRIYWNPDRPEMGVSVDMPSKCLASICDLMPRFSHDGHKLLEFFNSLGASPSRLDIALDTFEAGAFERARECVHEGNFTARARKMRDDTEWSRTSGPGLPTGRTIYFGSRQSSTYIRVYDKKLEQAHRGSGHGRGRRRDARAHSPDPDHADSSDQGHGDGNQGDWCRFEYEFKKEAAQKVWELLLARDFTALRSVMYGYLDFKVRGTDSNKSRWATCDWWLALLDVVSKGFLGLTRKVSRTIDEIGQWLGDQFGPSLTLYFSYLETQGISPRDWLRPFHDRWSKRHRLIYESFAGYQRDS